MLDVNQHITFLIRLTQLWSGVNLVVGLALAAFAVAAATLVVSAREEPPGTEVAAGVTAATLAVVALAALVWAVAHHVAGRGLRTRKPWARNLALMLAAFNLLLLPLGTALGLYTLWVLLHEHVRVEFHA